MSGLESGAVERVAAEEAEEAEEADEAW